ncbi:hypothetical protein GDO81_001985 [Engystomops pustulosus]|uniref:ZP domain-containing protein n=1 Tax=Engystomops pustulosus TaxID=76066 RepID=A0AAV7DHD8_ENGPU|nr:hypothetical protein GDO81_001985 [Engystomops pustulosus]
MGKWMLLVLWLSWSSYFAAQNAPPRTVFYQCNATFISVAVRRDPQDNRIMLDPKSLTLGRCPVSSTTALLGFLVFEYRLYDCGFSRMFFGNAVKFFTELVYSPDAAANVFPQPFREQISCISSIHLNPSPLETTVEVKVSGAGQLNFSYQVMTADFSRPLDVKEFLLGSPIFLSISVLTGNHLPLRLFVDECIVASTEDLNTSKQRYTLIDNHGCFVDGKVASSRFLEPLLLDTVRMTFQALKFVDSNEQIYLHCKLMVWDPKAVNGLKACSYLSDINGWQLLGDPQSDLCRCCDSTCNLPFRRRRDVADKTGSGIFHTLVLGPFNIHSPAVNGSPNLSNDSHALETTSAFPVPPAVGAFFLELAVLLLLFLGVTVYGRVTSPKDLEKSLLVPHEN